MSSFTPLPGWEGARGGAEKEKQIFWKEGFLESSFADNE